MNKDRDLHAKNRYYCNTNYLLSRLIHGLADIGAAKTKKNDPVASIIYNCCGFLTAKNQTEQLCSFTSILDTMLNG